MVSYPSKYSFVSPLIALLALCVRLSSALESFTFTTIGDIHYDILYNPHADPSHFCRGESELRHPLTFSVPGCDSSPGLVDDYFRAVGDVAHGSRYVFVMGDLPGHELSVEDRFAAYRSVVASFRRTWPNATFLPVLGNNDVSTDYCVYEANPDYATLRQIWGSAFPGGEEAAATWDKGGYYAVESEEDGLMIVVLNTVLYSRSVGKHQPCPVREAFTEGDPAQQAVWFQNHMLEAKRRGLTVWVLGHIPPNYDGFTQKPSFSPLGRRIWKQYYAPYFRSSGPATVGFFAHRHFDEVLTLGVEGPDGVPGFINPAVTPVFFNNPGFRYMTATRPEQHWVVADYMQFFASLWRANNVGSLAWVLDYRFSTAYHDFMRRHRTTTGEYAEYIDAMTMIQISNTLSDAYDGQSDVDVAQAIMARTHMHFSQEMLRYACSLQARDSEGYLTCLSPPGSTNFLGRGIDEEL